MGWRIMEEGQSEKRRGKSYFMLTVAECYEKYHFKMHSYTSLLQSALWTMGIQVAKTRKLSVFDSEFFFSLVLEIDWTGKKWNPTNVR